MNNPPIPLDEVLNLVREHWPDRYERGRITHVHRNAVRTSTGALVHLRVMVQTIDEPPAPHPNEVDLTL